MHELTRAGAAIGSSESAKRPHTHVSTSTERREPDVTDQSIPYEADCPWFDPTWLLDHPEFPLATTVDEIEPIKEESR
jgi:hypothetical protein